MATRKTKSKNKSKNTLQAILGFAAKSGQFAKAFQLGSSEKTSELLKGAEEIYGSARAVLKIYPDSENSYKLLKNSRRELVCISSCIMQMSPSDTDKIAKEFGTAVAAKITGVAASGTLLALVSAFGTAGTGAAISGLSGAAASSATLAWVGGLLGGGMATGALLTGGLSIVAGLAAYRALKSELRPLENLSVIEQRIVQTCWLLIAIIDDYLAVKTVRFDSIEAMSLLNNSLIPFRKTLNRNKISIAKNLDKKHAFAFHKHVLIDFDNVVINGFKSFVKKNKNLYNADLELVIGGVISSLMTDAAVSSDSSNQLALEAMRLMDMKLNKSSEKEISDFLITLNADQLKAWANSVKEICHELLWVEEYNNCYSETYAEVSTKTKDKRAMILIKNSDSRKCIDKWPIVAIDINKVKHGRAIKSINMGYHVTNSAVLNEGDKEVIAILKGAVNPGNAVKSVVKKVGVTAAATALTSFLFS